MAMFKLITYVPVIITFSIFAFLTAFYLSCYLYPTILGDFESTLGLPEYWETEKEREVDQYWAQVLACLFLFCAFNLLVSIILVMTTNPGNIPSDREWDMPDDIIYEPKTYLEEFTNEEINEDSKDPREPAHFDYRFLRSGAGPLYEGEHTLDQSSARKKQGHQVL